MKKIVLDIVSILENQGRKKNVRIVILNELRYDRISSDERRLKQMLLNFLIPMLERTKKGYLAVRLSPHQKQFDSIKITISSSQNNAYVPTKRAKLKLISYDDVITARKNKQILAHTVNTAIVGRLGPYSKISLKYEKDSEKSGTLVSFQIFQDINILASINRFGSQEENDLHYNQQAIYKSTANIQQEGDISELSSCDINYKVNKIIIENLNLQSHQFFPQTHQLQEGDEYTAQSSKKQAISPSKYSLCSDNHFDRGREFSGHFEAQLRSRSASSRSSDPAHRFDANKSGAKSQNYRISNTEEESLQHHDDVTISRKYLDQSSRNERAGKSINEPIINEENSNPSEQRQRKVSYARHHSEYIPSNSPSFFSKQKELQYHSVFSFPKESTMLLNPKRDMKTLKIPKKTLNGVVSEPTSQLLSHEYIEQENISDDGLSASNQSASRLQIKRLSKIATSASTIKVHKSNPHADGSLSSAVIIELADDSHLARYKEGLIKLQQVDLSENPADVSKTVSNITSLTHILH